MLTNSRLTRIGELLKEGREDATLLQELENYRSEFIPAYNLVVSVLTEQMGLTVTGRSKSTLSIVEKLRRSSIRLSQIQDIVGCRVIANALSHQDRIVAEICRWFPATRVVDKRDRPQHGYRAVHVLVEHEGRMVEVQVRTRFQHFWANGSEKLADKFGQGIKYGVGDPSLLAGLAELSDELARLDKFSQALGEKERTIRSYSGRVPKNEWKAINSARKNADAEISRALSRVKVLMNHFMSEED